MTSNLHREAARIYEFPAGGRDALGFRREAAKPIAKVAIDRVVTAEFGEAWYHDAAILNVEPLRRR